MNKFITKNQKNLLKNEKQLVNEANLDDNVNANVDDNINADVDDQ